MAGRRALASIDDGAPAGAAQSQFENWPQDHFRPRRRPRLFAAYLVMAALAVDFDIAFKWLDEKTGWSKAGPSVDFEALAGANKPEKAPEESPPKYRFKLVAFSAMRPGLEQLYLVDELIPVAGLVDIWGKAKCFKSFWTLDLMFHVAMGKEYRDRSVQQGTVVYCAFEGAHGYKKRIEAIRRHYELEDGQHVPLYIMPGQANLIAD